MSSIRPEPVLAEPVVRVPREWTVRFGLLWFGYWMAYLAPVQLVLPSQFDALDSAHKVRDFGLVSGLTGVAAIITLPLFGVLCDRTRSRFGRRRVWMAGGTVVFAAGLLLTGGQGSWWTVGLAWLLATLGLNAATAGATAAIADEVPDEQRGVISAAIYGPQAVGILVGVGALTALNIDGGPPANGGVAGGGGMIGYGVLAVVLLLAAAPFVARYRDVTTGVEPLPLSVPALLDGLRFDPRENPDFAWAFGGRLFVNLGNAFGTTYLLYFLQDDLKLHDPDAGLLVLTLVYLVFTLAATVLGGLWSDRSGRRRPYVAVAAVLQAR